ncbi:MAG: hypothetical protein JGK37_22345 [Microcoleus sp. PH2017_06_SFM_O_A]|nr:hypothetical protein [Microcoleus sp. PH2017_16_JOR_D_A]MCC3468647.1 hypothetical protein [Microcoleus sp. PH2017_06_SFM_O_A]MCC3584516.1 hypothetical protein [Microcoleus sp. PH2017_30_WIL_O_A]
MTWIKMTVEESKRGFPCAVCRTRCVKSIHGGAIALSVQCQYFNLYIR